MENNFIHRMRTHWTTALKLHANPALEAGWQQLADALSAISNTLDCNQWQVLQLPTGAGKTQALVMACSMPKPEQHPGTLIVTRFKDEADRIAKEINNEAGADIARAVHTDAVATNEAIRQSPVLIITHSAYREALRTQADGELHCSKMDLYRNWHKGARKWVIIDEHLDWVDKSSVDLQSLRSMCATLRGMLPDALSDSLAELTDLANSVSSNSSTDRRDRVLSTAQITALRDMSLANLREAIRKLPASSITSGSGVRISGAEMRTDYVSTVRALEQISSNGHGWRSRRGYVESLQTSRHLFDMAGPCGVILDATASVDPTYELLGERVNVLPRPDGIRNYANVTLHLSYGHKVGKEYLTNSADKEWPKLTAQLNLELAACRNVMVCSHKAVRPTIERFATAFGTIHPAHWGNMDGRNDWKDCDTAVLFGLPYLDNIAPANAFAAYHGPLTDDWHAGNRTFGRHSDIRAALKDGFTIKSVVQAINRIQCRKTIDAAGNCPETDIYILLPATDKAHAIVSAIEQQMPGIRIKDWAVTVTTVKPRRVPTEALLLEHLRTTEPGCYTKSQVIDRLQIAIRTFERLSAKIQQTQSILLQKLAEIGVEYVCGIGRGKEAYFIKR